MTVFEPLSPLSLIRPSPIATCPPPMPPATATGESFLSAHMEAIVGGTVGAIVGVAVLQPVTDSVWKDAPLCYRSLTLAVKTDHNVDTEAGGIGKLMHSILDGASAFSPQR